MSSVRLWVVLGVGVVALAFLVFTYDPGASRKGAPSAAVDAGANLPGGLSIGEPLILGNLAIFPVSSREPRMDDRFITLDEGLKAGTVEILEKGAAAANANSSGHPIQPDPFAAPPADSASRSAPNLSASDDPFAEPAPAPAAQAAAAPTAAVADQPPAPAEAPASQPSQEAALPQVANDDPFAPAGNEVNELLVVNRSEKPLYLMPGEIIVGGDQDRTIGQELVIAADGKPVAIDVFCVEHGRWGGRDQDDYAGLMAAAHQPQRPLVTSVVPVEDASALAAPVVADFDSLEATAAAANSGKFVGSVGSLNKAARVAVQQGSGQQAVWDEVARENAKAGVETDSGTFASNYSDAESVERLGPYLKHFKQPIEERENVVGVIVAVNGKVESLDVFESTPLFRKLWPKLLKSYALDAANAMTGDAEQQAVTRADAIAFFNDASATQAKRADTSGNLALSRGESDRVLLFSAHERRALDAEASASYSINGHGAAFGGGMRGFGGAIHSSGFSK